VEVRLADAEVVQHLDDVGRHAVAVVFGRIVRLLAAPVAARVDADHPMVARQLLGHPIGEPAGVAAAGAAVQKHHGRPGAVLHPVDPHPVRHHEIPVGHIRWGFDLGFRHRHGASPRGDFLVSDVSLRARIDKNEPSSHRLAPPPSRPASPVGGGAQGRASTYPASTARFFSSVKACSLFM
jgi:hypothetical protein